MKKLLVIMLSLACLLAIVSCDEAHPQNIEKEDMSQALGKVSESLSSGRSEKGLTDELIYKPIVKAAVDALKLVLDCTQEAEVNFCAGYSQSATSSLNGTVIRFFGTEGKVKFEYKDGIIVAAITNTTSIRSASIDSIAYIKIDFDFAKEKINSFQADFMSKSTSAFALFEFTMNGSGTVNFEPYAGLGVLAPQKLKDFYDDVFTPIMNETSVNTIDLSRVVARLKASDIPTDKDDLNEALQDVHNFLSAKGTKSGTVSGTFGSVTRAYKYDGNGVLAITDGTNDIAYIEIANNVTTYYYTDGQTWYKKASKPASIDLQETIKTAIGGLVTVGDAIYGYNFDNSTNTNRKFNYTLALGTVKYSFEIDFNNTNITKINLEKNATTIANLTVSGIGSTTIPNFATNTEDAVLVTD